MTTSRRGAIRITADRLGFRAIRLWRRFRPQAETPLIERFPWCSPNVWQAVTAAYASIAEPSVFEYGTGVSSLWHARNLAQRGGTYLGVEHGREWYDRVVAGFAEWADSESAVAEFETTADATGQDTRIRLESPAGSCDVRLALRPPDIPRGPGDGTAHEFASYISSLDRPFDLVVVDGRARVACVRGILADGLVRPGGTLVLHDAGRGLPGWLEHEGLVGTNDYRPAVDDMLSAGGTTIDGDGLDRWPNAGGRRAGVNAFTFPVEACILKL